MGHIGRTVDFATCLADTVNTQHEIAHAVMGKRLKVGKAFFCEDLLEVHDMDLK